MKPFPLIIRRWTPEWGWTIEVVEPKRSPLWRETAQWLLAGLFCGMLFMLVLLFGGS